MEEKYSSQILKEGNGRSKEITFYKTHMRYRKLILNTACESMK